MCLCLCLCVCACACACVCVQRKCDQYWPSEGEQTYDGGLTVHLLSTNVTAHYTVRMFSVRSPVKTLRKVMLRCTLVVINTIY